MILGIATLFLSNLLSRKSRFQKKTLSIFAQFEISLPQAGKQKEAYFLARKILQNFEGHGHWHCKLITF